MKLWLTAVFSVTFACCAAADSAEDLAKQIITEFQAGKRAAASSPENVARLEKAAQDNPNRPQVHFALGICYGVQNKETAVEACMEKAYATSNQDPQIGCIYCLALKVNKKPEKAREIAEDLAAKYPDAPPIIVMLAAIDVGIQRYKDAIPALEKLVERAATSAPAKDKMSLLMALGNAYLFNGEHVKAIHALEEANGVYPNAAMVLDGLGHAYLKSGDFEKSGDALDQALALNPEIPSTLYYRGLCFERTGKPDKARECFEKSYKFSKLRLRDNGGDYFIAAEAAAKLGKSEEAESHRKHAAELLFTYDAPWAPPR